VSLVVSMLTRLALSDLECDSLRARVPDIFLFPSNAKLPHASCLKRALDCLWTEGQFNVMDYFTNEDRTRRVPG
jgi:hypothetical protein